MNAYVKLPAVLVPSLDLRVAQAQLGGQLHAVLHTQVLLALETLLQRLQLVVRERCPRLALLLTESAVAGPRAILVLVSCNIISRQT